ncbi:hypothetical protein GCM10023194_51660 [Planotetraspora phitsanulokensis]|uniref:Ig-like domain-containing protein n=1 Tax=Planotetraspora phitsanulokensis TaxID=575192 RepID=A0A8J3UA30_9ACTN|nr:hypothetical protein Pph01_48550 [Planotetraspora phitsanulokensis]
MLAVSAPAVSVLGPVGPAAASSGTSTAYGWGYNFWGQVGAGSSEEDTSSPVAVSGLSQVAQVSAGDYHSLAVRTDGTVWAWGDNTNGQLGNGTTSYSSVPVPAQVPGLTGVVQVAAGNQHSLALRSDGTVWAWGSNGFGQLGDGSKTWSRSTPVKVAGLTGVTQISAGYYHSLAVRSDGTVWAWGDNHSGQLGDGTETERATPVKVAGLTGVTQVAGGVGHSLAVRTNGTVVAWGSDSVGQLGDGSAGVNLERHTPVAVKGLTKVIKVDAGDAHSLAVRSDGTVAAWGYNYYRQLGDGTTTNRATPVTVPGLTNVAQVSAGSYDSAALRSNGTVAAWGFNYLGHAQLADGTPVTQPDDRQWRSPVYVPGLSSVTQISTGSSHTLVKVGPPVVTAKASISGTGAVGAKLTCKASFLAATSVKYSWMRDTTTISGATTATYTPVTGDAAHKVTCKATGTNSRGSTDTSASINGYVPAKFSTGTPPVAQTGKYFIYKFAATGTPTPKVTRASGTLPPGLKLATGGTLSGTPTKGGTYTFTLQATGGIGTPTKATKTVIVKAPAKFTTATTPAARVGRYYIYKFPTTGYPAPKVTRASGTLPPGLKLAPGGTLSGKPTRKGTYKITLKATNGVGTPATATKTVVVR